MAGPKCSLSLAFLALVVFSAEAAERREELRNDNRDRGDVMRKIEEDFRMLEELMQSVLDIKKALQEQTIADVETVQRLADFDLVSFLDMLRAATTAKFELLGRLIDDIASGLSKGALTLIGQDNQIAMRMKPSTTSTSTPSTTTATTTATATTTTTTVSRSTATTNP